jgi:hypothetical protein
MLALMSLCGYGDEYQIPNSKNLTKLQWGVTWHADLDDWVGLGGGRKPTNINDTTTNTTTNTNSTTMTPHPHLHPHSYPQQPQLHTVQH